MNTENEKIEEEYEEEEEEEEISEEEINEMLEAAESDIAEEVKKVTNEIKELAKKNEITDAYINFSEESIVIIAKNRKENKIIKKFEIDLSHFYKLHKKYSTEEEADSKISDIIYKYFYSTLIDYIYDKIETELSDFIEKDIVELYLKEIEEVKIYFKYYKLPFRTFDIDAYVAEPWIYKKGWEEVELGSFFIGDYYDYLYLQPELTIDDEIVETICRWGDKRSIENLKNVLEIIEEITSEDLSEYKKMCEEAFKRFEEEEE
jgi:hypothetical protein